MKQSLLLLIFSFLCLHVFSQDKMDEIDYFNLAKKYEQVDNFDSSLHYYNKALIAKGDFKEAYYNRALLFKKMNIPKEAILDYKEVLKIDPTHPRAYGSMAALQIQLKDFPAAMESLNMQLQINPKDAVALTNRGICYLVQGKTRIACSDWRQAENLGSREAESMLYKYCN